MLTNKQIVAEQAVGNVMIKGARGLDPLLARRIRERLEAFACAATIYNDRGIVADARSILQLLMLGVPAGELIVLRCVGPRAHEAYASLADVLEAQGGVS